MINKISLSVMSIMLSFFIRRPCNAQVSYCTQKETREIISQILASGFHSINQEGDENRSFSTYIDSLTNVGLEKLKTTKNIVVLKTYSIRLRQKLDNNDYEKKFNDYFYFSDTIVSYRLYEKKGNGEFYTLGTYEWDKGNYRYSYSHYNISLNKEGSVETTILENQKYRKATLIWFSLDKVQLGLVLVNKGVLYRPTIIISQKDEYKFKNKEDEIKTLNLRYFKG